MSRTSSFDRAAHRHHHGFQGEVDMTPMVDVTFLLLIFFLLTASFTMSRGISHPPDPNQIPVLTPVVLEDPPDEIVVYVDEYNSFALTYQGAEFECPSQQELIRRLRDILREIPMTQLPDCLVVVAHGDSLHERVVMAIDAGLEVGLESTRVRIADSPWG